ncbi:MAG TPA: polysaccharide biosynthesis tyrosine autokinase [Pedobacter sp.]|uniref:GumC family protein n=1 Tax=Pedobacter sp. TaxID=1411316 RepID=UPI002CC874C4|nr:polysaccharide biosynthesis tyrosine autokinase [Pedobacter sp.]HMI02655.1 polysaccharide biosynthesis tyrosine autokinase [Pedobacter sp.]
MQKEMARGNYFQMPGNISYRKIATIVLSRWYWPAGSLLLGLIAGTIYIHYQQPSYSASASVKVEEKRSELSELINVRNIYDRTNKAESERFILKSRNVLQKALASIHYDIAYFKKERFRLIDVYPEKPIFIRIIKDNKEPNANSDFEFEYVNKDTYRLTFLNGSKKYSKYFEYGKKVCAGNFEFKIERSSGTLKEKTYIFRINAAERSLRKLVNELSIDETENTNIINLKITAPNPYFARDILNAILDQYLKFDKLQRAASVIQTETFIGSLLDTMSEAVKVSGQAIQEFKRNNGLLNLSSALNTTSNLLTALETQKHALDIQTIMIAEFEKRLHKPGEPDNLTYGPQDISDPQLNALISKCNDLIIKKQQLLNFYTPNSPEVKRISGEISTFMQTIGNNISSKLKNNSKTRAILNIQIDSIRKNLIELPKTERGLINLQSRFDVDQKIYNYLSEKQLEAQISRAAVTSGAVIIDKAILPTEAISPIPLKVYTSSVLISLFLGVSLIFFLRILDPCIYTRQGIEEYTDVPIIGIIRKYSSAESGEKIPVLNDLRSIFAESVRSVRSNLSFLASGKKSKIICITSEISGEGKSFVSLNIAASLTLIKKSVLLIATDMRKSRLHNAFHLSNNIGLSQYLSDQNDLDSIIKQTALPNLDFITSGPIPPNPAELLHSTKMEQLLKKMEARYDFIILDSAPVGLVTDGKSLIKMADINLFILRYGVSRHYFALSPKILEKEFNLSNFAIILNDYKEDGYRGSFYKEKQTTGSYYYPNQTYGAYHKEYLKS